MKIPSVSALVARLWMEAESETLQLLEQRHPDKNEEFVTELFQGEFRQAVSKASDAGEVKRAFAEDLWLSFPNWAGDYELNRLSSGLVASATFHPRQVEAESGGDLGVVLVRPDVREDGPKCLSVQMEHRRGLLCQVKIKGRPSGGREAGWGHFTKPQKRILPKHVDYLSLLLYEYADANRRRLSPFIWQLCGGHQFTEVEAWLRSGVFPDALSSDAIISRLGAGQVGTDDGRVIDQVIAPSVRDSLVVKVGWPPDQTPSPRIYLSARTQQEHVHVSVRRR